MAISSNTITLKWEGEDILKIYLKLILLTVLMVVILVLLF